MKRSNTTIVLLSSIILGGLLLSGSTSALEYTSNPVPVSFTFNSVLTLSTDGNIAISNLTPGNKAISANDYSVTVSTNSVAGYVLSASVGCATSDSVCFDSKILGDRNNNSFDMVESTTTLTSGKWGVSLDSSATANSNFQTLALYPATTTINQTTDASGTAASGYQGTQDTTFRVGAYASDSQVAGTYTNVINFTAVANIVIEAPGECSSTESCMQTFTADMCEAQASDAPVTLTDARDGSTYTVRYIEGVCWMTQNLRITGTVSSEYSNFSANSSVNVCEGDLTDGSSFDEARCHDSGNTTNGVWYNYAAASAKTITSNSNSTLATEDICPANWHLPSYDTNNTAGSINSLSSTSATSVLKFSPVAGGYYYNGSLISTGRGYWWSTTANGTDNRYRLYYDGSSLGTNNISRYYGNYIRCVRQ